MKALTVHQPWAHFIASGDKAIETCSWNTAYRGDLAIHAGKNRNYVVDDTVVDFGCILCIVELFSVVPTSVAKARIDDWEEQLGDFSSGRYAWMMRNVRVIKNPPPVSASPGLWEWNP